ncbi:MAG TPA: EAL domain-containing protein [Roseiarcus sp.]|nr:EAL domain-containing protein [Roseiarcus sp.]
MFQFVAGVFDSPDWGAAALAGILCVLTGLAAPRLFRRVRMPSRARFEKQLAERNRQLDAALNHMSQALCMFDADKRLIVCNELYARVFGLPPELTKKGTPLLDILRYRVSKGLYSGDDGDAYIRSRLEVAGRNVPTKSLVEFRDGRIFSVSHAPIDGGGWVATHEEVTAQVRAQRQLKETQATLVEETRRAERAAEEENAAHQRLLEASNLMSAGLVLFDAEDRHVLWNRRYAELFGESADAVKVGSTFEEAMRAAQSKNQDDEAQGAGWIAARLARHRLPENSEEIQLPDKRWIRVEERRTADGGSIGVRIDITDLKRREESFRLLFASNPLPMWVYDVETLRFLAVNDAAIAHYGYSRERFLDMTIEDIRPSEDAEKLRAIAGSLAGTYHTGMTWRHFTARGEEIEVAIYSQRLEHEGRAAALVAAVDITQMKRAEAEALRAREFLNTVIENVPAPIFVKNADNFQIVLVNRAAETFLGVPRVSLIGHTSANIYPGGEANLLSSLDRQALQLRREVLSDEYRVDTPGNGVRFITSKRLPILNERDEPLYLVTVINDLTERKRADERIAHLTSHDTLTDLANRSAFDNRLAAALERSKKGVALLCLDLDRFKEINDVYGHSAADRALQVLARRLQEAAGDALVARVGGDEFNVVVADQDQPAAAMAIADRVFAACADEIDVVARRIKIGVSIGVAISPSDGVDATTLLAHAEAALYRAKNEGGGVARFFESEMDKRLRDRWALQNELKEAVGAGQLRVHFQPQAAIGGEVFGFEALARWLSPTRGLVPPADFVPAAEESGIITEIGEWVLREACRQAASWPRHLSIAVNLSPVQFRQGDLPALIQKILVETGLPGRRLELEITEGVLIRDPASAFGILRRIKALGVRIAMDDFGTGYSSLSYLQSFPFDKIKIDRSFIANINRNPQATAIIRGVISLARGLQLPVIAEGVETSEQLAFLKQEGCDEAQGYLIGRPQPIEVYASLVGTGESGEAIRGVA